MIYSSWIALGHRATKIECMHSKVGRALQGEGIYYEIDSYASKNMQQAPKINTWAQLSICNYFVEACSPGGDKIEHLNAFEGSISEVLSTTIAATITPIYSFEKKINLQIPYVWSGTDHLHVHACPSMPNSLTLAYSTGSHEAEHSESALHIASNIYASRLAIYIAKVSTPQRNASWLYYAKFRISIDSYS